MALAAMKAKGDAKSETKMIGVTALTSLSDNDCMNIFGCSRSNQISRLKEIGLQSNIDGYVCSGYDINSLKSDNKIFVTPGIRIDGNSHDHNKVLSPSDAIKLGANYLVIGRNITESNNPNDILMKINRDFTM